MVNVTLILSLIIIFFSIICIVLLGINLYKIRSNSSYSSSSKLKTAFYINIACLSLSIIVSIFSILFTLFFIYNNIERTKYSILLISISLIFAASSLIFGLILVIDNSSLFTIISLILNFIIFISLFFVLSNVRKMEIVLNGPEEEEKVETGIIIKEVTVEPPKEEPTVYTSEFTTKTTQSEIVNPDLTSIYLPIEFNNIN
jgi:hypothetical protein